MATETKLSTASEQSLMSFRNARDNFEITFEKLMATPNYKLAFSEYLKGVGQNKFLMFVEEVDKLHLAFQKMSERDDVMVDKSQNPVPDIDESPSASPAPVTILEERDTNAVQATIPEADEQPAETPPAETPTVDSPSTNQTLALPTQDERPEVSYSHISSVAQGSDVKHRPVGGSDDEDSDFNYSASDSDSDPESHARRERNTERKGRRQGSVPHPQMNGMGRRRSLVRGDLRALKQTVAKIKETFMGDNPEFRVSGWLPQAVADQIAHQVQKYAELKGIPADNKVAQQQRHELTHMYDLAYDHVIGHIERDLFPMFVSSDDYIELMIDRMQAAEYGPEPSDVKERQDAKNGWSNRGGFKSLHVDVLEAKRLRDGLWGKRAKAYTVTTVGTATYKTKVINAANPDWGRDYKLCHFEFPLFITSTHVLLNIFDHQLMRSDKHLGKVEIAVADVVGAREAAEAKHPKDVSETQEEYEERLRKAMQASWYTIRKDVDETAKSIKDRGEIRVFCFASKRNPVNTGHKPVEVSRSAVLADAIRKKVSKKKRRFVKDGFDLDLTYITDRVIAMGYPSQNMEGVYRNNLTTVKTFFNKRHKNHFFVYNLCSERHYDHAKFDMCVKEFGFDDHNPCPFAMIDKFCRSVHRWLSEHPQNIAAIHCKAGKGRTGLMIGCYMLYTQLFPSALSSLKFYAARRTKNRKGVTIPSQIRWVHYYDRYLRYERLIARAQTAAESLSKQDLPAVLERADTKERAELLAPMNLQEIPHDDVTQQEQDQMRAAAILGFRQNRGMSVMERADVLDFYYKRNINHEANEWGGSYFLPDHDKHHLVLTKIVFHGLPVACAKQKGEYVFFKAMNADSRLDFSSKNSIRPQWDEKSRILVFDAQGQDLHLYNDVQFIFYNSTTFGKAKLFQCWLHTRFVCADGNHVMLHKLELDKANKDTKHRDFAEDFKVEMFFEAKEQFTSAELYSRLDEIQQKYNEFSQVFNDVIEADTRMRSMTAERSASVSLSSDAVTTDNALPADAPPVVDDEPPPLPEED